MMIPPAIEHHRRIRYYLKRVDLQREPCQVRPEYHSRHHPNELHGSLKAEVWAG
jgi:hypothetical protein